MVDWMILGGKLWTTLSIKVGIEYLYKFNVYIYLHRDPGVWSPALT